MGSFLLGLLLLCASTLMYEIVLTRVLSVTSWYYLAFVSVSTAMDVLQIETKTKILSDDSLDLDKSRGDAEECVDELALADYVALGQPPNLTLPDQCIASYPSIVLNAPESQW